jgi:hypothetical protein
MTLTISPPPPATHRATRFESGASSLTELASPPLKTDACSLAKRVGVPHKAGSSSRVAHGPHGSQHGPLGRYIDFEGRLRQVVALPGAAGSVLVVDRDAVTLGDRRLVAHLAGDEPCENAALVCCSYLRDPESRWCRRVTPADLEVAPFAEAEQIALQAAAAPGAARLIDRQGRAYRLELRSARISIPVLRWCRSQPGVEVGLSEPVSMREAIATLESYEPVRALTLRALALHHEDHTVSTTMLRVERERIDASQIVLNRGLRRAVLAATEGRGLSMSEIAIRCGRIRHDSRGNPSGETSWLARRLGIMSEGGKNTPTPWIHSDVLALIARCGLGISPREVELG